MLLSASLFEPVTLYGRKDVRTMWQIIYNTGRIGCLFFIGLIAFIIFIATGGGS